jgi:hypothetical protein
MRKQSFYKAKENNYDWISLFEKKKSNQFQTEAYKNDHWSYPIDTGGCKGELKS